MSTAVRISSASSQTGRLTLAQLKVCVTQKAQEARKCTDSRPSLPSKSALISDSDSLLPVDPDLVDEITEKDSEEKCVEPLVSSLKETDIEQVYERILGKRARPIKSITPQPVQYRSNEKLPEVFSLCRKVTITSDQDFDWLSGIDAGTETKGFAAAGRGEELADPETRIYSAISYWAGENMQAEDWLISLRNVYFSFIYEQCPYFYVEYKSYLILFRRQGLEPVAFISQAQKHFRDLLQAQGVTCEVKTKSDDVEEVEVQDFVKRKPGKSSAMPLVVRGKNVHALYNFLANEHEDGKMMSPVPFLNGAMRALHTTFVGSVQTIPNHTSFRLTLEGLILPSKLLHLLSILQTTQQSFQLDLEKDHRSAHFHTIDVQSIAYRDGSLWLTPSSVVPS